MYLYIYIYIYIDNVKLSVEGTIEDKRLTIWTDGKAEMGRVREEKRREEKKREAGARKE